MLGASMLGDEIPLVDDIPLAIKAESVPGTLEYPVGVEEKGNVVVEDPVAVKEEDNMAVNDEFPTVFDGTSNTVARFNQGSDFTQGSIESAAMGVK